MKILVNKCPHTGVLFENDDEYKRHIRKIQSDIRAKAKKQAREAELKAWLHDEKMKLSHPDEIIPWVLKTQPALMALSNEFSDSCMREIFNKDDEYVDLKFRYLDLDAKIPNTHTCPEGGVTNWHRKDDRPLHYPGWYGFLEGTLCRTSKKSEYPTTHFMNTIGIRPGSGGGGNEHWGFGASIYLADWPGFQKWWDEYEQDLIIKRLCK